MSRLSRACSLYGWRHIESLRARGHAVRAQACGVLHLGRDAAQEARMQAVVERLALPASHLRHVDAGEASTLAGWPLARGGWWFAGSGWVQPPSLCAANLAACGERLRARFRIRVHALHWSAGHWHALAADGTPLARAQVVVLAAGVGVRDFAVAAQVPLVSARGQVSLLAAASASAPRVVVCRNGYVSPEVDGLRCAGATFDAEDHDASVRVRDHRANLDTLEAILPGYTAGLAPETLGGRVGFRPASPDRLPMVGALPAAAPGLHLLSGFGARGLVWSALCAELLACRICAEPLPLERDLCAALDPARFSRRTEARRRYS